ncbi:hypothetical protein F5X96DRAFT_249114 [Biscogniauxia mediterranea]|nr:hypothetical protein F5X96DRAFT_249114 [Biscogniauxia mediterranea]
MPSQLPFDLFQPLRSPSPTASIPPASSTSTPFSFSFSASLSLPPARLEALWVAASFLYILGVHTFRDSVPIFARRFRFSRNALLLTHIALAIAEVSRYHIRAFFSPSSIITPDALDLLVTVAHSLTCLVLARDRKVGDRALTRPTHQSQALIRIALAALAAYAHADAQVEAAAFYQRAAVRVMNAFLYPRLLIRVGGALAALPSYSAVYAASMFVSCLLCLHDAGVRFGPQAYVAVFVANVLLNRWVAERVVESERDDAPCGIVPRLLSAAGFVELKALRDGREAVARERRENGKGEIFS